MGIWAFEIVIIELKLKLKLLKEWHWMEHILYSMEIYIIEMLNCLWENNNNKFFIF